MSIATAITNLQGRVESAYDKIEEMGGTLPQVLNTTNLPNAIDSIPQEEIDKRKYGATIDDVYYNPSEGKLQLNGGVEHANFTGISSVSQMSYAFYNNTSLKSVSFLALSSVIGQGFEHAFEGCTNLSSASFPEVNNRVMPVNSIFRCAFKNSGVKSAIWPKYDKSVGQSYGSYDFEEAYMNSQVEEASFPSLTYIGSRGFSGAFKGCSKLSSISFPELNSVGGAGLSSAFQDCTALSSALFPKLGTINESCLRSAFEGCTSLKTVCLSALSSQSGNYALYHTFRGCTSLTSITIPNLSTCNASTFEGICENCDSLVSAVFPELRNSAALGLNNALKNCPELTTASFPELHTIAGNYSANHICEQCPKLTTFSMPKLSSVSGIGAMADCCNGATALTNVSFPSLVRINNDIAFLAAFKNTGVTELSFPQLSSMFNVATSGNNHVFGENNTITKINLPKLVNISSNGSLGTGGKNLFRNCTNLVEIHFGAENQTIIEGSAGYATKWGAPNANCQIYFDL